MNRTGDIRWQRVVNASQKEGIYNWLREHFPVKTAEAPVIKKDRTQGAVGICVNGYFKICGVISDAGVSGVVALKKFSEARLR